MEARLQRAPNDDRQQERRRRHEDPTDDAPAAEFARERAAFGIAEPAKDDREKKYPSAGCGRPVPWTRAKTRTATSPSSAASQNPRDGRSPPRNAAIAAVADGSRPATTAPCAAGASVSAQALSSGKPNTTPSAVKPSRGQSRRGGTGHRPAMRSSARRQRGNQGAAQAHHDAVELAHRQAGRRETEREAEHGKGAHHEPGCRPGFSIDTISRHCHIVRIAFIVNLTMCLMSIIRLS